MTGQQVINEIADDRIRFVAELRHDPANQNTGAAVPFEVDDAVRFAGAVDLGPAMRTAGADMLGRNELEFLFELRSEPRPVVTTWITVCIR